MRTIGWGMTAALVLALTLPGPVWAGEEKGAVKAAARNAGQVAKKTARAVGHATRDSAKAVGHAVRDTTKEVGHAVRDAVKN